MRELAINRMTLPFKNRKIEYSVVYENDLSKNGIHVFSFTTVFPHGLTNDSKLLLRKEFSDEIKDERLKYINGERPPLHTMSTEKQVTPVVIDDKTFQIEFSEYELYDVENFDIEGHGALLRLIDRTPYECVNDEWNITAKSVGVEYQGQIGARYDPKTEEWENGEDYVSEIIVFAKPMPYIDGIGKVYIKNTWHLKYDSKTETEFDTDNIGIYEYGYNMVSSISLSNSMEYKNSDSKIVAEKYMEDITASIIPDIIDNEKRQFMPVMAKGDGFKTVEEIVFNLHFRSREDEDVEEGKLVDTWKTNDTQIWNGFEWSGNPDSSSLERIVDDENYTDDLADALNYLGFTEDDIKYQKTKVKKTFIRLMFYSSKDMLDKELLYYSTIFLDSGKLYNTYGNIMNSKDNRGNSISVFDDTRTDEKLRLSASFSVKNKYDTTKSSEGFYLYLFPNEVTGENKPRTIYMKVEFNHAGYGKTIPMMLPRHKYQLVENEDGTTEYNYKSQKYHQSYPPIESTSEDFPTSFLIEEVVDKNGNKGIAMDFERYTDSIMIPVNIIYDTVTKNYLYYFPWFNRAKEKKITINLWEPRIRGGINGTN